MGAGQQRLEPPVWCSPGELGRATSRLCCRAMLLQHHWEEACFNALTAGCKASSHGKNHPSPACDRGEANRRRWRAMGHNRQVTLGFPAPPASSSPWSFQAPPAQQAQHCTHNEDAACHSPHKNRQGHCHQRDAGLGLCGR